MMLFSRKNKPPIGPGPSLNTELCRWILEVMWCKQRGVPARNIWERAIIDIAKKIPGQEKFKLIPENDLLEALNKNWEDISAELSYMIDKGWIRSNNFFLDCDHRRYQLTAEGVEQMTSFQAAKYQAAAKKQRWKYFWQWVIGIGIVVGGGIILYYLGISRGE